LTISHELRRLPIAGDRHTPKSDRMVQDSGRDRIVTRSMAGAKIQDFSSDVGLDTPAAEDGHRRITGTSLGTSSNLQATPLTTKGRGMDSLNHQTPGKILVDKLRQQMRRGDTVSVSNSVMDGMDNSTPSAPNAANVVMKPGKAHTSVMIGTQPANQTAMASASLVVPCSSSAAIGSTPVLFSTLMTSSGSAAAGGSVLPTGGKGKAGGAGLDTGQQEPFQSSLISSFCDQ
jgi:hypothetical protein